MIYFYSIKQFSIIELQKERILKFSNIVICFNESQNRRWVGGHFSYFNRMAEKCVEKGVFKCINIVYVY